MPCGRAQDVSVKDLEATCLAFKGPIFGVSSLGTFENAATANLFSLKLFFFGRRRLLHESIEIATCGNCTSNPSFIPLPPLWRFLNTWGCCRGNCFRVMRMCLYPLSWVLLHSYAPLACQRNFAFVDRKSSKVEVLITLEVVIAPSSL